MSKLDSGLLHERYGHDFPIDSLTLDRGNDALRTILAHKSIRSYDTRPLEPGVLELLVAAGESASTSSNLQSYSIVAIEDTDRKRELSVLCGQQQHIVDAPLFLIFCADLARLKIVCDSVDEPSEGLDYTEMFIMSVVDASLAAQNLVVAAESIGLGTCYIGGARNYPAKVADILHLPEKVFAVFGITIGYPVHGNEEVKPRFPQPHGILHREQYNSDYTQSIAIYEEAMKGFNLRQAGREGRGWTTAAARRVATAESLGADRPFIRAYLDLIGMAIK